MFSFVLKQMEDGPGDWGKQALGKLLPPSMLCPSPYLFVASCKRHLAAVWASSLSGAIWMLLFLNGNQKDSHHFGGSATKRHTHIQRHLAAAFASLSLAPGLRGALRKPGARVPSTTAESQPRGPRMVKSACECRV